ncbi:hypothetical protein EV361DRAFT_143009 [Lentinula raphanica]|uniref:Uncharacterized protein n=1 Tax=Lentinula raphanica TaxID=153919 RepID=A0AA38PJF0_9AGAR|nr:hypothetical protein FB446DRAFT_643605 [Lentinula raphanica]KAJ3821864.1 hypothetical protein F5880DRAFT_759647 [Lentinula raphanica]KAJ3844070.1 hypothetical protein F5878DRAFT_187024 [Lentinula raphanica]KAJ3972378.1 hypothetical protein EV361DRAFT_143009 [Lentinula raphanica]
MSVKPGNVATHIPTSLPSFAQTFSSSSLSSYGPDDNSLPPIHDIHRAEHPPLPGLPRHRSDEDAARTGRKRTHAEASSSRNEDSQLTSDRNSPSLTRVKEEPEQDMLASPPPQPGNGPDNSILDTSGAPPPSSLSPPKNKKRRVTISGAPALNTDVRIAPDQTNSTPISPAVIGFTVQRDNPTEVEQVRSMITVKQQQQALIEQRRGSTSGMLSPTVTSGPSAAAGEGHSKSTRSIRRSPNSGVSNRRHNVVPQAGTNRPASPNPNLPPPQPPPTTLPSHSLPPPPISFARRRANQIGSGKKKPADIMISPRNAHTPDQFAPSIQSAPPIPHAGQQGGGSAGRFPMALPRLPSAMGDNVRRTVGGNVPPTPTRFSAQRMASSQGVSHHIPGISGRSPPNASVAISSTLVPATPSALHNPGYSGEKSAFLAPFESFYDALNDSKQLKNWLGEQLQKSKVLIQSLTQQQDKLQETVDNLVEKKVAGLRSEMVGLHRRVEELEDALRIANSSRRPSLEGPGGPSGTKSKGKQSVKNGNYPATSIAEGYTFPPISSVDRERLRSESSDHRMSPGWTHEKDPRDTQDSDNGSPAPYESRRLSLSSSRLELPRSQSMENISRPFASPSLPSREGPSVSSSHHPPHPPPPSSANKLARGSRPPGASRQHSSPRLPGSIQDSSVTSSTGREQGRRNSIVDGTMDD